MPVTLKTIKISASSSCEICGGEPYAMVRRPRLSMQTVNQDSAPHSTKILCKEHFKQFRADDLIADKSNGQSILPIAISFVGLFFLALLLWYAFQ